MAAAPSLAAAPSPTPRWILHIDRYSGGISNGVRAMVSPRAMAARAARHAISGPSASVSFGPNVQMNTDSNPPLPQNETAVATSLANPKVAVAAANDYVTGGNVRTRQAKWGPPCQPHPVNPCFCRTADT